MIRAKPYCGVHIRYMIERDMTEVLAIEADSFDDPWTEEDLMGSLRLRDHIGVVAEKGNMIVAYAVYGVHRGYYSLVNLAVAPLFRRVGVGSQIVEKLKRKVGRRRFVMARVPEALLSAQLFFKSHGFRWVETERAGGMDFYRMEYRSE